MMGWYPARQTSANFAQSTFTPFGFPAGISFFDNAASPINNSTEYKSPFSLPYERHNPAFGHKRREGHFNLQTTTGR